MEPFKDVISDFRNNSIQSRSWSSFQSTSSLNKQKTSCFPFSVSRMTHRVAHHLFRRNKRRSARTNKQHSQLTTNMDLYQYTPSDNELQQLLYI